MELPETIAKMKALRKLVASYIDVANPRSVSKEIAYDLFARYRMLADELRAKDASAFADLPVGANPKARADNPEVVSSGHIAELLRAIEYVLELVVNLTVAESAPVTQTREFSFVSDADLRSVLERDYGEIQRCYVSKCWKSVIILSGGAIEAILTDVVLQNSGAAASASKSPKKSDIRKWDLADLINVAVELNLVSSGIDKLSHSVREYRNLVHPGNEIRNKLAFGPEEARIALEVLHILHRDLS